MSESFDKILATNRLQSMREHSAAAATRTYLAQANDFAAQHCVPRVRVAAALMAEHRVAAFTTGERSTSDHTRFELLFPLFKTFRPMTFGVTHHPYSGDGYITTAGGWSKTTCPTGPQWKPRTFGAQKMTEEDATSFYGRRDAWRIGRVLTRYNPTGDDVFALHAAPDDLTRKVTSLLRGQSSVFACHPADGFVGWIPSELITANNWKNYHLDSRTESFEEWLSNSTARNIAWHQDTDPWGYHHRKWTFGRT